MADLIVTADGWLSYRTASGSPLTTRCALGRGGVAVQKHEGDGVTPAGRWPLRSVLYRPDRGPQPTTVLPVRAITPHDGWCDDPAHPAYNQPITRPFPASHEQLWRADALYDLVVVLGHNDAPPIPGAGSAIFLHIARPGFKPTEGCVAIPWQHLYCLLTGATSADALVVRDGVALT